MAGVGDEIVVVIRRARPISATALASATAIKVRRGDVRRALVVSLFTLHKLWQHLRFRLGPDEERSAAP